MCTHRFICKRWHSARSMMFTSIITMPRWLVNLILMTLCLTNAYFEQSRCRTVIILISLQLGICASMWCALEVFILVPLNMFWYCSHLWQSHTPVTNDTALLLETVLCGSLFYVGWKESWRCLWTKSVVLFYNVIKLVERLAFTRWKWLKDVHMFISWY